VEPTVLARSESKDRSLAGSGFCASAPPRVSDALRELDRTLVARDAEQRLPAIGRHPGSLRPALVDRPTDDRLVGAQHPRARLEKHAEIDRRRWGLARDSASWLSESQTAIVTVDG